WKHNSLLAKTARNERRYPKSFPKFPAVPSPMNFLDVVQGVKMYASASFSFLLLGRVFFLFFFFLLVQLYLYIYFELLHSSEIRKRRKSDSVRHLLLQMRSIVCCLPLYDARQFQLKASRLHATMHLALL